MLSTIIHHAAKTIVLFVRDVAVLVVAYAVITGKLPSLPDMPKQTTPNKPLKVSWYDPSLGGVNCDGDCSTMASGVKVTEARYGRTAACIPEWTKARAVVAIPGIGKFECLDTGGAIKETSDYIWIDLMLHEPVLPFGSLVEFYYVQGISQEPMFAHIYDTAVFTQPAPHGLPGYEGVDISAGCGAPILAPFTGEVVYNGLDGYIGPLSGGEQNTMLVYKSLTDPLNVTLMHGRYTAQGIVRQGDVLGYEASNGNSTGCHSHVVIYQDHVNVTDRFML